MKKQQIQPRQRRHKKKKNKVRNLCMAVIVAVCVLFSGNMVFYAGQSHAIEGQEITSSVQTKSDVFANTVFLGNSYIETLKTYGLPKNSDFYSRVGLTVESVFTKTLVNSDILVIDAIDGKSYDKIFLVFGENELGWSYPEVFINDYKKLIAEIKKTLPTAGIYVMGIVPVTEKMSEKNEDDTNNERIGKYNELLNAMAVENDVTFIAPAPSLMTDSGALIEAASTDGIHLNSIYCKKWIDDLKSILEAERKI